MLAARSKMAEVMALVRQEVSGPAEDSTVDLSQSTGRGGRGSDDRASDRINDRNRGLTARGPEEWLNPRQRWYLEALTVGKRSEEHTSELQSLMLYRMPSSARKKTTKYTQVRIQNARRN